MWSAEALLPVVGATCALRFEPEHGDWSCWKLWMEKTTSYVITRGNQKFSFERGDAAQICQVTHTIWRRTALINDAFEHLRFEG